MFSSRSAVDVVDIAGLRDDVYDHLRRVFGPHSPLVQLWAFSYVEGRVLVLPAEGANTLAEAHPRGYHSGVWQLAIEYEELLAKALLTNSNAHAPGHRQPKSFSAWPRRHDVALYRQASEFRATLAQELPMISIADRIHYLNLVQRWHQSVLYISKISGHTRLDQRQLQQLRIAFNLDHRQEEQD